MVRSTGRWVGLLGSLRRESTENGIRVPVRPEPGNELLVGHALDLSTDSVPDLTRGFDAVEFGGLRITHLQWLPVPTTEVSV